MDIFVLLCWGVYGCCGGGIWGSEDGGVGRRGEEGVGDEGNGVERMVSDGYC